MPPSQPPSELPHDAARRLAEILDCTDDAVITLDLLGAIQSWNRSATNLFGHAADEMIGASLSQFLPDLAREELHAIVRKVAAGERINHFETQWRGRADCFLDLQLSSAPLRDNTGEIAALCLIARDVTALRSRERELARVSRFYTALSQINQAIAQTATREELFKRACTVLVETGGFHLAWIGWHDESSGFLQPVASCGDKTGYLSTVRIPVGDHPDEPGPTGAALRTDQPVVCNDLRHDSLSLPWQVELERRGFRATASFPIRCEGRIQGALAIYATEPHFFRAKEISLLEEAAKDLSFALDNFTRNAERERAEQKIRQERDFSEALLDSLPGVVYFYNETGQFLRWNANFASVAHYTSEELARSRPLDFIAEPDKQRVATRIREVFTTGHATVEAGFAAKDGTVTPYYFTGTRTQYAGQPCLVGVGIDISERTRAEASLAETKTILEGVVENLTEGLIISDPAGTFFRWNTAALRMLGFDDLDEGRRQQAEFYQLFVLARLDGSTLPLEEWPIARARRGEVYRDYELRVRRTDRNWERVFSYSGASVRYGDNRVLAFVTMGDITERIAADRDLREAHDRLEHKVAARTEELRAAVARAEASDEVKSAFLATMSHELRTPLNSIIGFTGIVLQELAGPLNPEQKKQLGMVRGSARHLLELINDVLDISKIEAGQLQVQAEPFALPSSLERVLATVRPFAAKKPIELQHHFDPALGEMHSDRRRVEQILLNLLSNAIKFTERGTVTLEAALVPDFRRAPDDSPVPAVRLRVSDTGIGIKSGDLTKLFQPFRQIDSGLARTHDGTGLGLAICRRLAVLLGGTISVASEWNRGSVFTVVLPLRKPASP